MDDETKVVSVADLARIYGLSVRTIYRWVHSKRVPFLRASRGHLRFDAAAVRAALENGHSGKGADDE